MNLDAKMTERLAALRLPVVRVVVAFCVLVATLTSFRVTGAARMALTIAGAALAVSGMAIRLWATLYIAGRKTRTLVMDGPYSLTRNPLYLGAALIGIGLIVELGNPLMVIPLPAIWLVYYGTIIREETKLEEMHKESFAEYVRRVPRFLPSFKAYAAMESLDLKRSPKYVFKGVMDAALIAALLAAAYYIPRLQEAGTLPVLWRIM